MNKKITRIGLFTAIVLVVLSCGTKSKNPTIDSTANDSFINGTITDADTGTPMANLGLNLYQGATLKKVVYSDASGNFKIENLPYGVDFHLDVDTAGYFVYNGNSFAIEKNKQYTFSINLLSETFSVTNAASVSFQNNSARTFNLNYRQTMESFLGSPVGITFTVEDSDGNSIFIHFDKEILGKFKSTGGAAHITDNNLIITAYTDGGKNVFIGGNNITGTNVAATITDSGKLDLSQNLEGIFSGTLKALQSTGEQSLVIAGRFSLARQK